MYLTCDLGGRIGTEDLKKKDEFRKYHTLEDFDLKGRCKSCIEAIACISKLNIQKAKIENDLKYICMDRNLV